MIIINNAHDSCSDQDVIKMWSRSDQDMIKMWSSCDHKVIKTIVEFSKFDIEYSELLMRLTWDHNDIK